MFVQFYDHARFLMYSLNYNTSICSLIYNYTSFDRLRYTLLRFFLSFLDLLT